MNDVLDSLATRRIAALIALCGPLLAAGCVLAPGEKDRCLIDADCRTGRICVAAQCRPPADGGGDVAGSEVGTGADAAGGSGIDDAGDRDGAGDLPGPGAPDSRDGAAAPVDVAAIADGAAAPDLAPGAERSPPDAGGPAMDAPGSSGCPPDHFSSKDQCISRVVQVAAANQRTCAVLHSGQVFCWGGSAFATRPERVPGLDDAVQVAVGGSWGQGGGFGCALTRSERVVCWGSSSWGALGDGMTERSPRSMPQPVVTAGGTPLTGARQVVSGDDFLCAATADAVLCWGESNYGELGLPRGAGDGVVEQPSGAFFRPHAAPVPGVPVGPLGASHHLTVSVDRATGNMACGWGGITSGNYFWPVFTLSHPEPNCATTSNVAEVAVGGIGACFRFRGGDVSCWGFKLGGNDLPGMRAAIPQAVQLAAGLDHACAVLADGRAFCWGAYSDGQLGNGEMGPPFVPKAPQHVATLGSEVVGIGSGHRARHTCAILRDGSLQCWGRNDSGQLGNSTAPALATRPVPVDGW